MSENKTTAPAVKRPNRQLSVSVPAETFDGFYDNKWTAKKETGAMFLEAIEDYVVKHGIVTDGTAPHAPAVKRGK